MFQKLTNSIKSALAAGIMIILMIAFLMSGSQGRLDAFRGGITGAVITAGGHSVSPADFKLAFDNQKQQLEQQYQTPISVDEAVKGGFDRQILAEMANQNAIREWLSRLGFRVSDRTLAADIHKNPNFANPVTGQFDPQVYKDLLAQNGITAKQYEQDEKETLAGTQFAVPLQLGSQAPSIYSALAAAFVSESRDASYFVVDEKSVPVPAKPTDAEVAAFLKDNAASYTRPEMRTFTVVRFDPKDFESQVTVDPAEIQKQFDFKKDTLSKPETRTVVQFPAKDANNAADIVKRLKAGADPVTLARANNTKLVTYDDKPKSAIPDAAVANAAFALKEGEISAPVKTQFGTYVVLKVEKVTAGAVATLESAKADIEKELKEKAATKKAYAAADIYDNAHKDGASMADAARKAGITPRTFGPVSADGAGLDGKPVEGLAPDVLQTAFATAAGSDSDSVKSKTEQGVYFTVRVEKVAPPAQIPLAEIKDKLVKQIMQQRVGKAMEEKALALQARLDKGESFEAVAKSAGFTPAKITGATRQEQDKYVKDFGRQFAGGLLSQKAGATFMAATPKGIAVVKIDAVKTGDPKQMALFTAAQRAPFGRQLIQDISPQLTDYARTRVKPKIHRDAALTAIGLDPKAYPDKPKKADKKTEKKK